MDETASEDTIFEMRSGISRVFEDIVETRRTISGVYVSPETSLQCSAVLACVKVISESVASLKFSLMRRLPGGGKEVASDMPLHKVISESPNSWMTSFEYRELMQSWLLLWGNAYASIIPSAAAGSCSELIPLHPSRMLPERLPNGRIRYTYTEPNGEKTIYRQEQIHHLRQLSQDGVTGYVPTTLSRDAIGLARACELHSSSYFGSGARPGIIIETDQPQKPETLERLRRSWEDMHRGPERNGKTAVLPHGMHVKELTGGTNSASQLIETRRYQIEDVARAYRVPIYMIGDMTKSSYSSVEQQALDFVTFCLVPHLRRIEAACLRDLVTDDANYFCEFDLTSLMAGDHAAKSAFFQALFSIGAVSINEIRDSMGYNPIPAGDKRFVQVNMQLLEAFKTEKPIGEFKQALRKLAAIEADGIRERRNKPAKLESWIETHTTRMHTELSDLAKATGIDIDDFVRSWIEKSKDLLLECLRSGKPYEEALETWTTRANLSDE